jgi:hypothetical protein
MIARRTMLAGMASAATGLTGLPARANGGARREFAVLRAGTDIGRHSVALTPEGDGARLEVDVELVVRLLGIAVYRYTMTNRELWRDGVLIEGDSDVNDDGRRKRVLTRREGGQLIVDSPDFSGTAPSDVATTTYFTPDFLNRAPWLSTDSGDLFPVRASQVGPSRVESAEGEVACTRWRVTDNDAFDVMLDYDERGEWMSVGFDAGGEPAVYRPLSVAPAFGPIWSDS